MDKIESLELKIAKFLRAGVVVAGLLMLVGWLLIFNWEGNPLKNFHTYSPLSPFLHAELAFMDGNFGILLSYTGLVALISLPVIRVFLTMILFIKQKEFILGGIAAIVLVGLFISFSFGFEH